MSGYSHKLLGIIGKPLEHSLSPHLHNHMLKKYKLPFVYLPFNLEEKHLKKLPLLCKLNDIWGLNVTAPYKEKIIPYLSDMDTSAKSIGAVNTIVRKKNKLIGYNTDPDGWWSSVREKTDFNPKGALAIIVGKGGAAKAIASQLKKKGASKIFFLKRPFKKKLIEEWFPQANLLLNATPAGQQGSPPLKLSLKKLNRKAWVMDLVYNPTETPLLKEAKKRGHPTLGGLPMLASQAALSFELWTGKKTKNQDWYNFLLSTF